MKAVNAPKRGNRSHVHHFVTRTNQIGYAEKGQCGCIMTLKEHDQKRHVSLLELDWSNCKTHKRISHRKVRPSLGGQSKETRE